MTHFGFGIVCLVSGPKQYVCGDCVIWPTSGIKIVLTSTRNVLLYRQCECKEGRRQNEVNYVVEAGRLSRSERDNRGPVVCGLTHCYTMVGLTWSLCHCSSSRTLGLGLLVFRGFERRPGGTKDSDSHCEHNCKLLQKRYFLQLQRL